MDQMEGALIDRLTGQMTPCSRRRLAGYQYAICVKKS
jgi:hypothetical protein